MNELLKILYKDFPENANPFAYVPEAVKPAAAVYNRIFQIGAAPRASKDWRTWAPPRERQYWIPFCVSFSRLNCGETKAKSEGVDINLSDRELGVGSGTTIYGNSLEAVSEYFRKTGVRTEDQCPFTDQMLNYAGDDIWKKIFDLPPVLPGQRLYQGGNHSWVYGQQAMIDAMDYSPLQIAVGIDGNWEADGIVQPPVNVQGYHAVMLLFIDTDGKRYIQDSVGKEFKILSPDYPLTGCKSFRDLPENWKDIMPLITFVHKIGTSEYGFIEKTTFTEIYHKAISEEDLKFQATKFGVNVLNADGTVNFAGAKDITLP